MVRDRIASSSDSEESSLESPDTSEADLFVPIRTRSVNGRPLDPQQELPSGASLAPAPASRPPDEQAAGSSEQPSAPSSTSQSAEAASSGQPPAAPVETPSTSNDQRTIMRVGCTLKHFWHLLRQHEPHAGPFPPGVSFWATTFKHLSAHLNGQDNRLKLFQKTADNRNVRLQNDFTSSESELSDIEEWFPEETAEEDVELQVIDTDSDVSIQEKQDDSDEKSHLAVTTVTPDSTGEEVSIVTNTPPEDDYEPAPSLGNLSPPIIYSDDSPIFNKTLAQSSDHDAIEATNEQDQASALIDETEVRDSLEERCNDTELFDVSAPTASTSRATPSPATKRKDENKERRRKARGVQQAVLCSVRHYFVPTDKIGRIVGKRGRTIKEIEAKTGTSIKILNRKSNQPVTQITITGPEQSIEAADEAINIIIRNYMPVSTGEHSRCDVCDCDDEQNQR